MIRCNTPDSCTIILTHTLFSQTQLTPTYCAHRHAALVPVHHPERVAHIDVGQLGQPGRERGVILCVPRMEACVLQEAGLAWRSGRMGKRVEVQVLKAVG